MTDRPTDRPIGARIPQICRLSVRRGGFRPQAWHALGAPLNAWKAVCIFTRSRKRSGGFQILRSEWLTILVPGYLASVPVGQMSKGQAGEVRWRAASRPRAAVVTAWLARAYQSSQTVSQDVLMICMASYSCTVSLPYLHISYSCIQYMRTYWLC